MRSQSLNDSKDFSVGLEGRDALEMETLNLYKHTFCTTHRNSLHSTGTS
jgi:hypothetical protein